MTMLALPCAHDGVLKRCFTTALNRCFGAPAVTTAARRVPRLVLPSRVFNGCVILRSKTLCPHALERSLAGCV